MPCSFGYKGAILWDKNKPDGTPRKKLDLSRMSKLGWESTTTLDDGIIKTINAYDYDVINKKIRR